MQPDDKLNIDSLTLDNVIGDGVETVEDVQDVVEEVPQEVEEEVQDEHVDPEVGDEDADDDYYEQPEEEETYVEDEHEEEEPASVAAEVARTLGFELEGDYDDSLEGITNFVRDISQNAAEDQLQSLFEQFPEVQQHLDYVLAGGDSRAFFQSQGQQVDYSAIEVNETMTSTCNVQCWLSTFRLKATIQNSYKTPLIRMKHLGDCLQTLSVQKIILLSSNKRNNSS